MPVNISFIKPFIEKLPIKGLSVVFLFLLVIFGANWYIDQEDVSVPLDKRCSPEYPLFSVQLDNPEFLDGGNVRAEDMTYHPGAFWVEKSIVMGCPCSVKKCVRRCCSSNTYLNSEYKCVKNSSNEHFSPLRKSKNVANTLFETTTIESSIVTSNTFGCKLSNPILEEFYHLENLTDWKTFQDFYTIDNTTVTTIFQEKVLDLSKYCIGAITEGAFVFKNCSKAEEEPPECMKEASRLLIRTMMMISIVLNAVTFAVFAMLPRLRSGYGHGLMCYVASRCFKTIATQIYYTSWLINTYLPCVALAFTIQFFETTSRAWQVVISYQMWAAFRPVSGSGRGADGAQDLQSHLLYGSLAWGLPLVLAVLTVVADLTPGVPDILRPLYAMPLCWYNNLTSLYVFFVAPVALGELVNLVRCLCTLRRLGDCQRDSQGLQDTNRRHNAKEIQWSSVYLKVCLVMGVNYILGSLLVLITWTSRTTDFFRYAAETVMHMRGVEVFFIFVLKKKNLKQLLHNFGDLGVSRSQSTQESRTKSSSNRTT